MPKMTKADIEKRQLEILTKLDEMDEKTNVREAKKIGRASCRERV